MCGKLEQIRFIKYIFTIIAIAPPLYIANCKTSTIEGSAPDYAGQKICLYHESDGIFPEKIILSTDSISNDGKFCMVFNCDSTIYCKMDLGYYQGCIFVPAGQKYSVNLPPRKDIGNSDRLNPYFTPEKVLLSINDPDNDDINLLVGEFEDEMDNLWNTLIFNSGTISDFNSTYEKIENKYANCNNKYFNDYRKFSYSTALDYFENKGRDLAIRDFLLPSRPEYSNPAYWGAINTLLENFKYLEYLKPNRELYEIALLCNVANGHIGKNYLDSISLPKTADIAQRLKFETMKTVKGADVSLPYVINLSGDTLRWADVPEPYIYICFANSSLRESLSDMAFVRNLKAKWKRNFAFIFIFIAEDKTKTEATCSMYPQIEYICSINDNPEIAKAFGVKVPPAYFVITNTGKFEISPAPVPAYFEP